VPRRLRIHVDHAFYHVTLRGNHRQPVFFVNSDRNLLDAIVARSIERYAACIHAYCWMTNHLHLLIQVGVTPLGDVMRQIASGYARAVQKKIDTTGHLFERRYHARFVTSDTYLLELLRYIHLNPVQAKMVTDVADYRWSSHHAYIGGRREPWLTVDFALALFAAERSAAHVAYRRFMAEGDPDWKPDDAEEFELPAGLLPAPQTSPSSPPLTLHPRQTLDELLLEACARFDVRLEDLLSFSRRKSVVLARGWLGREAVTRRVAPLSEVARRLGKDRSTLRHAIGLLAGAGGGGD
jgi:REP element-mobilizing transposase RayT